MLFMAVVYCSTGLALGAESRAWGPAAVGTRVTRITRALLAWLPKARAPTKASATAKPGATANIWRSAEAGASRPVRTPLLAVK